MKYKLKFDRKNDTCTHTQFWNILINKTKVLKLFIYYYFFLTKWVTVEKCTR